MLAPHAPIQVPSRFQFAFEAMLLNPDLLQPTLQSHVKPAPLLSRNALMMCGFFGGPFAAMVVQLFNSRRAGRLAGDQLWLAFGFAAALLVSVLMFFWDIPQDSNLHRVVWRVAGLGFGLVCMRWYRDEYARREFLGLPTASPWLPGVLAVAMGIVLELIVLMVLTGANEVPR
jgi:hypothetical protein